MAIPSACISASISCPGFTSAPGPISACRVAAATRNSVPRSASPRAELSRDATSADATMSGRGSEMPTSALPGMRQRLIRPSSLKHSKAGNKSITESCCRSAVRRLTFRYSTISSIVFPVRGRTVARRGSGGKGRVRGACGDPAEMVGPHNHRRAIAAGAAKPMARAAPSRPSISALNMSTSLAASGASPKTSQRRAMRLKSAGVSRSNRARAAGAGRPKWRRNSTIA